jgi:hypothetical protein
MWQDAKLTSNDMKRMTMRFRAAAWLSPAILLVFCAPCFAQAPITNGLVARWTGDGNAKDSAGHFDGQVSGGLRYGPGPAAAQAFYFGDGGGQGLYSVQDQLPPVNYTIDTNGNVVFLKPDEDTRGGHPQPQLNGGGAQVDFGSSIGNFGTRDFTIAFWIKTDSKYFYEAFLGKRPSCDGSRSHWNIFVAYQPGTRAPGYIHCGLGEGGEREPADNMLLSTHPINDGQWHHVVWVRQSTSSGSSMALLYLDGALDISRTYRDQIDLVNQAPLVLGQHVCQCCDGCHPYSGAAAELQIFSHALTAEEIVILYKAQKADK